MTQATQKSGRAQRAKTAGGVERRAHLAGHPELRRFKAVAGRANIRSAASTDGGIILTGKPLVYSPTSYQVNDQYGSFTERIAAGALTQILPTADCRLLYDHAGLVLARTASGTMTLKDTPAALTFQATLDPRMTLARDLSIAVARGDVSQMSIGFTVADGGDQWSSDFSTRLITRFASLIDISAVCSPASPTTSIAVGAINAGPDGTWGENWPAGFGGVADGTGSRSLKHDLATMRSTQLRQRARFNALPPGRRLQIEADELRRRNAALQKRRKSLDV